MHSKMPSAYTVVLKLDGDFQFYIAQVMSESIDDAVKAARLQAAGDWSHVATFEGHPAILAYYFDSVG